MRSGSRDTIGDDEIASGDNEAREALKDLDPAALYRLEFKQVLDAFGLESVERGPWVSCTCAASNRVQGWKLHLTSTPTRAVDLLCRVLPLLTIQGVSFKLTRDIKTLISLNDGELGETQVGKFVTIYPRDDEQATALADGLVQRTQALHGPRIVSDMWLGGVVYARYGGFSPKVIRDRFGFFRHYLEVDGRDELDEYEVPFRAPSGIKCPFALTPEAEAWSTRVGATSDQHVLNGKYLLLDVIKAKPRGSVFLAVSQAEESRGRLVVLKQGKRGTFGDTHGRDISDRLKHQLTLHNRIQSKRVPTAFEVFEHEEDVYLVLEHVHGRAIGTLFDAPLGALAREGRLNALSILEDLVRAVQELHSERVVHRDLTPGNILVRDSGEVCLIDLELAYSVDCNQVPFSCGTPAYMSPQQQNEGSATESDDVYALGSVVVRLVCGVDPRKVKHIEPERRAQSIAMLAVTQGGRLAGTLSRCLDDDPTARPPLGELARALNESKSGTPKNNSRLQQDWMPSRQTLRAAYNGLMSASAKTTDGALFISAREKSAGSGDYEYELLRSAHNGNAGVLYLISRYSSCGLTDPPVDRNVANSIVDWLLAHRSTSDDQMPGLHFGEAGVATALSEAIAARLIDPGPWTRTYLQEVFSGTLDWPDFTHGAAGQGIAALTCARLLGDPFPYDYARSCTEYLIGVQDRSGAWPLPDDVKELAGVRYTGFAHGAAGIVYYLLEYLRETSDPAPERSIDAALQWLISLRVDTKPGSWPIQPDSSEAWSWWCHGGPGIALAFLKAYEVFGDKAFAEIAEQALLAIPSDIRSGNLSHCHGLSGIGEAYLEAYRVLGDEAWLALATHVARTILALSRETAEGWLVWKAENPHSPTADLMLGSGGICHFLLRLVEADYREISLPLHVPRNVTPVSMQ